MSRFSNCEAGDHVLVKYTISCCTFPSSCPSSSATSTNIGQLVLQRNTDHLLSRALTQRLTKIRGYSIARSSTSPSAPSAPPSTITSTTLSTTASPLSEDFDRSSILSTTTPPAFEAKVYSSDPVCIGQLPDSSSLLSGPGLSPPPPNRFRLVVHTRTQSVPLVSRTRKSSHKHARSIAPGSEFAGNRRPSYADDPHTPGLFLKGRGEDFHHLTRTQNSEHGETQHRHSDNSHRTILGASNSRLPHLRRPEPSQPVRQEGERAGRGGGGIVAPSSQSIVTGEEQENTSEARPTFPKGHRRQRTGIKVGSVKDRITSFETLGKETGATQEPTVPQADRPSTAPELRGRGDITPPFVYPARAGRGQLNEFKPGDELQNQHDSANMVRARFDRLSTVSCTEDDLDLPIDNNELLTMNTPRSRGHARSQTVATVPRRDITTAAAILHEPECHDYYGHSRSQSIPAPTPQPMVGSATSSRSTSPSRLVPANSHPTMFPSAFRLVADEQLRPGSAGSMSSNSTLSDTCPPTPTSTTPSSPSSWFNWSTFTSWKRAQSPSSPSPMPSPTPTTGSILSPLHSSSDAFGLTIRKGVGDHWADDHPKTVSFARNRTVSTRVHWDDEESVRFSWF